MDNFRHCADPINAPEDEAEKPTCYAVLYVESHPDKERTFLGVFSSEEKAQKAIDEHMAAEKARLPRASIGSWNYSIFEGKLDERYWY